MVEVNKEDLAVIRELGKLIGREIPQIKSRELKPYDDIGYRIDNEGQIVGLSLFSCGLEDISLLSQLTNLMWLSLYKNQITDIAPVVGLKKLVRLNLGKNEITEIQPLANLKNLKGLILRKNKIDNIKPISGLESLIRLNLGGNKITDISPLMGLEDLMGLSLGRNEITDIRPISSLKNLENIVLSKNTITNIEPISELKNLTMLHINENNIIDISPLKGLKKLKYLHLKGNQFTNIEHLAELKNLIHVDLRNNPICELPESVLSLNLNIFYKSSSPKENQIILWNNPLEVPPVEIVKDGNKAIQNYFESIRQEKEKGLGEFRLYEAKLLIVGRGDVGKTWLTHRLVTGKLPEKDGTTRGIDIHAWRFDTKNIKNFRANFWDFGGQQILHSTHQFFLTKRSLYLFVWEARTDDDIVGFDYWLNIIKLLSDSSPVIVVMNKCDERIKNIDERTYEQNFNILGFYRVSAKENTGIEELRSRIQEEMVKLPHIGTPLPQVWMTIREKLEGLRRPYISYREYLGICSKFKLDRTQADHLSGYYHNVGVILHFRDNPVLQETVFLQPEWETEAVYQVVENIDIQKRNGRFQYEQLGRILDVQRYPVEIHHKLLELMKKFELCFELDGENEYIVPELLKGDRPKFEWDYQNNLQFEYDYKFMPAGIITRFIARVHELHKDELYWKSGVVLDWEGHTQALVICETINRKIRIWIRGQDTKGLLAIIRHHIGHIHETLNRPEVEQMLPCICKQCQQSREPYFHKYQELLAVQEKGKDARCNKSAEDISIENLFGEYGMEEESKSREEEDDDDERGKGANPQIPNQFGSKEKTTVWRLVCKIVAGLILLAGGVWTGIQIWESDMLCRKAP